MVSNLMTSWLTALVVMVTRKYLDYTFQYKSNVVLTDLRFFVADDVEALSSSVSPAAAERRRFQVSDVNCRTLRPKNLTMNSPTLSP